MKKIVFLVVFAAFLTACSQYTCPTYSKKEAPKNTSSEKRI
jgi:PBP1b-binding outer membrane lipoprotein LpoB